MLEVELWGISQGAPPMVVLRHDDRVLPILINFPEANAIQLGLAGQKTRRPMTHDLVCNLLAGLRGDLQSVTIYKLEDDTYFAHLNIEQRSETGQVEQVLKVDSRPSDGMAVAVRVGCPIYVAEEVMDQAGQDATALGLPMEGDGNDDDDDDDDMDEDDLDD